VWVLVIVGTLRSQRFSRILEETLDMIFFMRVHCDNWDNSKGHHQIGVVLGNVFVQIPFPKHLFAPRTPYGHIQTEFWRFGFFPVSRLTFTFVHGCQGPVGFCLLDPVSEPNDCSGFVYWCGCVCMRQRSSRSNVHTPCKLQRWSSAQSASSGVPAVSDTAICASRAACMHTRFQEGPEGSSVMHPSP